MTDLSPEVWAKAADAAVEAWNLIDAPHRGDDWFVVARAVAAVVLSGGIPLKLGWSNPDCGPESLRLYALDQGDQPRWAEPHARVAETVLLERGAHEGSRWLLIPMPEETDDAR